jgi:hypothetical protein
MSSSSGSTAVAQPPVTRDLAAAIVAFKLADLPDSVLHEAKRSLFNVLAVAIGASRHSGVDAILRVARETGGVPVAPIVGRSVLADARRHASGNGDPPGRGHRCHAAGARAVDVARWCGRDARLRAWL